MKTRTIASLFAFGMAASVAAPASAAERGAGSVYTKESYPVALVDRPLTLAAGMLEIDVPVNIEMSKDRFGKPVSIAPSLYYGVGDSVTVGIFHETGLCLTGTDNGCAKVYNDVGAQGILSLYRSGDYQLVAKLGLDVARISDPTVLQGRGGLAGKGTFGRFALAWDAGVTVVLTNRAPGGNESLDVTLTPQIQILDSLAVVATIGLSSPFESFSDVYQIPVGFGLELTPVRSLDVGARFAFTNLLGKFSTADARVGQVFVRFRL